MNLCSNTDYYGTWTLPGVFDNPVPGQLECGHRSRLTLHAGPLSDNALRFLSLRALPNVHGQHKSDSILACSPRLLSWQRSGEVRLSIGDVYIGPEAVLRVGPDSRDPRFSSFTFGLEMLEDWVGRAPLAASFVDSSFSYDRPAQELATLDRATVTLWGDVSTRIGHRNITLEHNDRITVETVSPIHLREFLYAYARPFQYYLSLAYGATPQLTSLVATECHSDGAPPSVVDIFPRGRTANFLPTVDFAAEPFFELGDIAFSSVVPSWYSLVDLFGSPCDLLFDRSRGFITNRFFDSVSAAEAMHHALKGSKSRATPADRSRIDRLISLLPLDDQQWARSRMGQSFGPTFPIRLQELVEHVGSGALVLVSGPPVGTVESVSEVAAEYRNRIAHSRDIATIDMRLLADLDWRIRGLMRLVLYRELGHSEQQCHQYAAFQLNRLPR